MSYQGHTQKLCEIIQQERHALHDSLWHFFDAISPIYDEQVAVIEEAWLAALKQEMARRGLTPPPTPAES